MGALQGFVVLAVLMLGGTAAARGECVDGRDARGRSCSPRFSGRLVPAESPMDRGQISSVSHGRHDVPSSRAGFPVGPQRQDGPGPLSFVPPPQACSSQEALPYSGLDLVDYVSQASIDCLLFLWIFNPDIAVILSDANVQILADEAKARALTYPGDNSQKLLQLIYAVRSALYHRAGTPGFTLSATTMQKIQDLTNALSVSPHLYDFNPEAGDILGEWVKSVDTAFWGALYVPQLTQILTTFNSDPAHQLDYRQQVVVYAVEYLVMNRHAPHNAAFGAAITPAFFNALTALAGNLSLPPSAVFARRNAIFALGWIALFPAHETQALTALNALLPLWQSPEVDYLWVIKAMNLVGCPHPMVPICMPAAQAQALPLILPDDFSFDDGALTVKTHLDPVSNVTAPVIQTLYHATKQVAAQFQRVGETLVPVPGDPNPVLKVVLFRSPGEYQDYAPLLFNGDPNNGGVYLEQPGTFLTYQRPPGSSVYTLEELFRHEYVHYMVGRYLLDGMWGVAPIYANNRTVWFDEGLAEFLTGSTPSQGIQPRLTLVNLMNWDGTDRLTVNQVTHSTYNGFKFYRYAATLFLYLHQHEPGTFRQLLSLARRAVDAPSIAQFDALVASLANDSQLEISYQAFIDSLIANSGQYGNPVTLYPDLATLDSGSLPDIQSAFRQTRLGYLAQCSLDAVSLNPRFSCRGVINTSVFPGPVDLDEAWQILNGGLDEIITELVTTGTYDNFQGVNCRMGSMRVSPYGATGYVSADYHCDGPLAAGSYSHAPNLTRVQADFSMTRLASSAVCASAGGGQIACSATLSTQQHPSGTASSVYEEELSAQLAEVHNQVYAAGTYFYGDMTCGFTGPQQVVPYLGTEYALRPMTCSFTPPY
jgi:microbial collagenase